MSGALGHMEGRAQLEEHEQKPQHTHLAMLGELDIFHGSSGS